MHREMELWINVKKPVDKGVLSAEAVENRVENVDEWGNHALDMQGFNSHFMHATGRGDQYFTKFGEECLSN